MSDRKTNHEKAERFFEELWERGDPWDLESSDFERAKYEHEIAILNQSRYEHVLEMGCGAGSFTRHLVPVAGRILALDISPKAIARARQAHAGMDSVDFRVQNVMDYNPRTDMPWDLIVVNETIYYLGWLYTFFEVSWFAAELFASTRAGGQLLIANTCGGVEDYLLTPSIIRTYHDLFDNVGYKRTDERVFNGTKSGAPLEVLISLFTKPADGGREA